MRSFVLKTYARVIQMQVTTAGQEMGNLLYGLLYNDVILTGSKRKRLNDAQVQNDVKKVGQNKQNTVD